MANKVPTSQSGIKKNDSDMTKYSLFLGGMDTTHGSLAQYSPLKVGFSRLFITRMPVFMDAIMPDEGKRFKHMLEYAFTGIDGIQNDSLEFEQLTGGYAGAQFDVATQAKDETTEVTVKLYEFQGSPVREYLTMWMSGISDKQTGIGHYHGCVYEKAYRKIKDNDTVKPLEYSQQNHTMEAVYVVTDPTAGSTGIEYACLLTNMMPKQVKKDHLNFTAGQHGIAEIDVPFTVVKYESKDINNIASRLVKRFGILRDYLDFESGYNDTKAGLSAGTSIAGSSTITNWNNGVITAEQE